MSTLTVKQRVDSIVKEVLRVDPARIMPSSRFKEDLGSDSLDLVTLIMALEEEFNGLIADDEAAGLITIGDAVNFIEKKCTSQSTGLLSRLR
jgi:acyl carrier protein